MSVASRTSRRARRAAACAGVLVALTAAGGCSGADQDVRATVTRFHEALASADGAGACAALSPAARDELTSTTGSSCAESVLEEVDADTGPWDVQVFGDQAIARHAGVATFLAKYADGWRVAAVGCTEKGHRDLFDCALQGS